MFLKKFSFEEKFPSWKIDNLDIENITLLVGASGVGKTKIINGIRALRAMANGYSPNGIKWKAEFVADCGSSVVWEGETALDKDDEETRSNTTLFAPSDPFYFRENNDKDEHEFLNEKIFLDSSLFASRQGNIVEITGHNESKILKTKSLLYFLGEEDEIKQIVNIINKIEIISSNSHYAFVDQNCLKKLSNSTFSDLCHNSSMDIGDKLLYIYTNLPEEFKSIEQSFVSIFQFVEKLRFYAPDESVGERSRYLTGIHVLQLKECNSEEWISVNEFSSGMLKVLNFITALKLSPHNSIFLIDEFENSFGLNCINEITEEILDNVNSHQFIMSSHHPYIINKIPYEHWRLVTRAGGIVQATGVENLISSKSKHEAFLQLINMKDFSEGINCQ